MIKAILIAFAVILTVLSLAFSGKACAHGNGGSTTVLIGSTGPSEPTTKKYMTMPKPYRTEPMVSDYIIGATWKSPVDFYYQCVDSQPKRTCWYAELKHPQQWAPKLW